MSLFGSLLQREGYSVALPCILCHKPEARMTAGSIVIANYLTHDEEFQSFGLW